LNAAFERSKEAQDRVWNREVESFAERRAAKALSAYHQRETLKNKHNQVRPPPK
jgi:hypothetical protein